MKTQRYLRIRVQALLLCFIMSVFGGILMQTSLAVGDKVQTISRYDKSEVLYAGKRYQFNLRHVYGMTYTTSNRNVVSVTNKGVFMPRKTGRSVIRIKKRGRILASCSVTVRIAANRIILNKFQVTLEKGQRFQIRSQVLPANATSKNVYYASQNNRLATVTAKTGVIRAVAPGRVRILVTAADGSGVRAILNVTVYRIKSNRSGQKTSLVVK